MPEGVPARWAGLAPFHPSLAVSVGPTDVGVEE